MPPEVFQNTMKYLLLGFLVLAEIIKVLCASHLNLDQSILSAYIRKRLFAFNFCVGLVEYILVTVMVRGRKECLKQ